MNNHDRGTRVYKFQLKYRECFLQVPRAFRNAEFALKLRTRRRAWEEASEAFKIISTLFGCRLTALWGNYLYVAANLKSFLLSGTSQRLCSFISAPASVHGAISITLTPNNRPGHPFKLESFTFSPQCKPRCKQKIVNIGSNLLIQIRIIIVPVCLNTILKLLPWVTQKVPVLIHGTNIPYIPYVLVNRKGIHFSMCTSTGRFILTFFFPPKDAEFNSLEQKLKMYTKLQYKYIASII